MLEGIVGESHIHPILRWGERVNNQIKRGIPENSDSLILRNCRSQGRRGNAETTHIGQERMGPSSPHSCQSAVDLSKKHNNRRIPPCANKMEDNWGDHRDWATNDALFP